MFIRLHTHIIIVIHIHITTDTHIIMDTNTGIMATLIRITTVDIGILGVMGTNLGIIPSQQMRTCFLGLSLSVGSFSRPYGTYPPLLASYSY